MDIGQYLGIGQLEICVLEAGQLNFHARQSRSLCQQLFIHARVNPVGNARGIHLPGEAIDHGFYSASLIGLDFELQFHAKPSLYRFHFSARRQLFEDLFHVDLDGVGDKTGVTEHNP